MSVPNCREPIPKKWSRLDGISSPISPGSLVCTGYMEGRNVIITDPEEIYFLYHKGNFGTCVTRKPKSKPGIGSALDFHTYERRKKWREELASDTFCPNNVQKVDVIINKSEENIEEEQIPTSVLLDDPYPLSDLLQLDFLDSLYIMHSLQCLNVCNENMEQLDINLFWKICCNKDTNFIPLYVSYQHFRRKGWVIKNGLKFGTNLLLYKDGPAYYHASYSVIVHSVTSDLSCRDPLFTNQELRWTDILAWNRTTDHVSKELIICYVVRTKEITKDDLNSPDCLSFFKIQEVLIKRWKSCEEREQDDC